MPLPNTRIVVVGVPRADKDFDVVESSAKEAARLAKLLQTDIERAKAEIRRQMRGPR